MRDYLFHQGIYSFSSPAIANATMWNHAIGVGAVRKYLAIQKNFPQVEIHLDLKKRGFPQLALGSDAV